MFTSKKLFVVVLFALFAMLLSACTGGDCPKGGTWESADGNPNYKYGLCKMADGSVYPAERGIGQDVDASDYSKPLGPQVGDPDFNHITDLAKRAGDPVDNVQHGVDTANSCHWEKFIGTDGQQYNQLVCTAQ